MEGQTKETYTDIEVIEASIMDLGRIVIPVEQDRLARELARIRHNLIEVARAMHEAMEERKDAKAKEAPELLPDAPAEAAPEDGMFGEEAGPEVEPEG